MLHQLARLVGNAGGRPGKMGASVDGVLFLLSLLLACALQFAVVSATGRSYRLGPGAPGWLGVCGAASLPVPAAGPCVAVQAVQCRTAAALRSIRSAQDKEHDWKSLVAVVWPGPAAAIRSSHVVATLVYRGCRLGQCAPPSAVQCASPYKLKPVRAHKLEQVGLLAWTDGKQIHHQQVAKEASTVAQRYI